MSVPKVFLEQAFHEGYEHYEVPLPVRYVLEKGWKAIDGTDAICVDVPYDENLGAMVSDGYEDFFTRNIHTEGCSHENRYLERGAPKTP